MTINLKTMDLPKFKIPDLKLNPIMLYADQTHSAPIDKEDRIKAYLQDIGITGIAGVEGSGKSLLMTKIATEFYHLGGTVLAFPGYELKNGDGTVISHPLTVEQWIKMDETLRDVMICIDEIEDHFNAQSWQSIIVRLFTGVFGQRRKRNMGIVYTLQFFEELPKLMRRKTHYVIECVDAARYNPLKIASGEKTIQPGTRTYTTIIDNYGKHYPFIPGYRINGPIYRNEDMFEHYETFGITDIYSQFTKVEINRKVVSIDLNGDGVITEKESKESQRLYEKAYDALVDAPDAMTSAEFWPILGLDRNTPAHQKIASQACKDAGYFKNANGLYKRRRPSPSPSTVGV
jgi:hypothetical protein